MIVSQGTYMQDGTVEYIETEFKTEDFRLKIVHGKDNFTTKWVYKPVVNSFGISAGGRFWTEYPEALNEGLLLLEKQQKKLDEEKILWREQYKPE